MARNTIQKQFATTTVKGFTIKEGQPIEVSYELDKKCDMQTAQNIIRKNDPTFAAVDVEWKYTTYKMTFDDFKKYATPIAATE